MSGKNGVVGRLPVDADDLRVYAGLFLCRPRGFLEVVQADMSAA